MFLILFVFNVVFNTSKITCSLSYILGELIFWMKFFSPIIIAIRSSTKFTLKHSVLQLVWLFKIAWTGAWQVYGEDQSSAVIHQAVLLHCSGHSSLHSWNNLCPAYDWTQLMVAHHRHSGYQAFGTSRVFLQNDCLQLGLSSYFSHSYCLLLLYSPCKYHCFFQTYRKLQLCWMALAALILSGWGVYFSHPCLLSPSSLAPWKVRLTN